jgi:hypothetical protein
MHERNQLHLQNFGVRFQSVQFARGLRATEFELRREVYSTEKALADVRDNSPTDIFGQVRGLTTQTRICVEVKGTHLAVSSGDMS